MLKLNVKRGEIMKTQNILFLIFISTILFAHGGEKHDGKKSNVQKEIRTIKKSTVYQEINNEYLQNIKPIIQKKCFDCHGTISKYPWYYKVPGVKQMIDYDIKEAKEHLDMSKDFPFISHETPLEDLKSFKRVTKKGTMPPLRYILGHWDSSLNEEEKRAIIQWSEKSLSKLEGESDE